MHKFYCLLTFICSYFALVFIICFTVQVISLCNWLWLWLLVLILLVVILLEQANKSVNEEVYKFKINSLTKFWWTFVKKNVFVATKLKTGDKIFFRVLQQVMIRKLANYIPDWLSDMIKQNVNCISSLWIMHPFLFFLFFFFFFFFKKQRTRVQRYQVLQMELLILLAQQRLLVVRYDSRVTKVTSSGELPREPAWLITRGLAAHLVVMVRFTKLLQTNKPCGCIVFSKVCSDWGSFLKKNKHL